MSKGLCPVCQRETIRKTATTVECSNPKCVHSIQPFSPCTDCGHPVSSNGRCEACYQRTQPRD